MLLAPNVIQGIF